MNIHNLRTAQVYFDSQLKDVIESRKELYKLRNSFVKHFNFQRIGSMRLGHYAIGNELPQNGYNFCYTLERGLDGLGRIIGATSFKFGVYYGITKSDPEYKYRFTKKFGSNLSDAYKNIKSEIQNLLISGREENIEAIVENKISPMFKGKILSTYFPERYLNIFSDDHLEYYLVQLNIDTHDLIWSDEVIKREALLDFKNQDEVMKNWSVDIFSYFLYMIYPGRPPKEGEASESNNPLKEYRNPNFPLDPEPCWIEMAIEPPITPKSFRTKGTKNPDYEKKARKLKKLGDRGEKLVLEMERKRLEDIGLDKLAAKVEPSKYDYLGYDIKSFEENGDYRYIEVKTTSSKVGAARFFLSINELSKAKELANYYIYVVFDVLSKSPKIWRMENPFKPTNKNVVLTPVSYSVVINANKKLTNVQI